MSALSKVFVVFVFLLSVIFFGSSATLFTVRYDWKKAYQTYRDATEKDLVEVKSKIQSLTAELDTKSKTISQLEFDQNKLGTELKTVAASLAEEKNNVKVARSQADAANEVSKGLQKNLDAASQEKQQLVTTLENARKELDAAKSDASAARKERDSMRVDLDATQVALHEAKKSQKDLSEKVETLDLVVSRYEEKYGPIGSPAPPIDAKVKAVDASEGLVVLSVGRDDEVKLGHEFTVYRGDKYIGKVRVIKVYPNLSGARIEWTKEGEEIQSGDQASTRILGVN